MIKTFRLLEEYDLAGLSPSLVGELKRLENQAEKNLHKANKIWPGYFHKESEELQHPEGFIQIGRCDGDDVSAEDFRLCSHHFLAAQDLSLKLKRILRTYGAKKL